MLAAKGTPDRPIVIRAAGDGEPIFDGDGAHRLFDVSAADYHIFEGLTIRNTDVAFYAGMKDVGGSKGLTVRRCRLEDVGIGETALWAGSEDFYIADNVFLGRDDRFRLLGWYNPGSKKPHLLIGSRALATAPRRRFPEDRIASQPQAEREMHPVL